MADTKNDKPRAAVDTPPLTTMSIVAPALAWLIPGAGHLIQKRYVRGFLLMFAVVTMFFLGLAMQGRVYKPNGGDILDILGFVGDVGAGGLRAGESADVAGLLNFICVADAYHIAIGKKP